MCRLSVLVMLIWWIFSFFIISAVPKCVLHDVVIINGIILLMYMMSTASVTFLFRSNGSAGRSSSVFICTFDGVFVVIFPLSELKFVPSISSARNMSAL